MFLLNNIWKIHFLNIRLIKRYFYHSITENRSLNEYKAVFVSKFLFNILINPDAECRLDTALKDVHVNTLPHAPPLLLSDERRYLIS